MNSDLLRSTQFPKVSHEQWRSVAEKAIGAGDVQTILEPAFGVALNSRAITDRRIDPKVVSRTSSGKPWRIVQRVDDPDVPRAAAQVRRDVEGGATGLALVFEGAAGADGFGLPATPEALAEVLDAVPLNKTHLRIDAHPNSRLSADWLLGFFQRKRPDAKSLSLSFGIDPSASFAATGRMRMSFEALHASMPQSLAGFFALNVPGVLLEADGRVYHNAGASAAQELGAMLSTSLAHLRMFEAARQPIVYAAPHVGFAIAIDHDKFLGIAKLRALRLLWARVLESCGVSPTPATIHAETSLRMLTKADAETNILRNTIAGFAAAVGGADTITIVPHSAAHGLADSPARAIARNTQLVLLHESGLDHVLDPAAGAGSIETLTEKLAESAWHAFQEIESEGGIYACLAAGHLQHRIAASSQSRIARFAAGESDLVGVTLHKPDALRPVAVLAAQTTAMPTDGSVFCEKLPLRRIESELATG
jgi:methylmalonyl-CoA mutase